MSMQDYSDTFKINLAILNPTKVKNAQLYSLKRTPVSGKMFIAHSYHA